MIRYYRDADGYLAVDTSTRVRQVPGFLYGKCATSPGDLSIIVERIWDPSALSNEVPVSEVPCDWVEALGFESKLAPKHQHSKVTEEFLEGPNLLPQKSYLVPLIPLEEYDEWLNRGVLEEESQVTDIRYPENMSTVIGITMLWLGLIVVLTLCM